MSDMIDDPTLPMRVRVSNFVTQLQDKIIKGLEELDPNYTFLRDAWTRAEGGSGVSGVLSDKRAVDPSIRKTSPSVFEKAGINISLVQGKLPPPAIAQMKSHHASIPYDPASKASLPYFAGGISIVIHPRNPHAPTIHANYRYFEITSDPAEGDGEPKILAWWFGGGSDLTPSYLYEEDTLHFHKTLYDACAPSGPAVYPAFKAWCDEYFYLPHRKESRGIGGIFYDDLCNEPHHRMPDAGPGERPSTPEEIFTLMKSCGESFLPSYIPILKRRIHMPFTEEERRWQLLRRGRYVEFNLIIDRGTKFGLQTPGVRIESVLMSLPETARWEYMTELGEEEGTREAELLKVLRSGGQDWLGKIKV
ncbi:Oxygen-dependent coproporphyrinogen-III oxidase, mitochondrial Short=COX; Short=Coprogen oxidase; Short=Coproporphyrinogenase; Flags: Precursor [Serendipita indica DSM 11827]|nr:Oxygen-dependent coproporphyrinogen-III oxidase, mitochondrial Short=COX; Short=Coprogen oxidase; Short=Coproporphyrinogenase; Flags: Precursor [Serendipita indica DSM 11827]